MDIVLFYDGIHKLDERTLRGLAYTRKWIVTLSEEKLDVLFEKVPELFSETMIIKLDPMKREYLMDMLERYARREKNKNFTKSQRKAHIDNFALIKFSES